jgi:hypothetical protein
MMPDKHFFYNQLTPEEKFAVDEAYRHMIPVLTDQGLEVTGDDRAEELVNAIAKYVLECQPGRLYVSS